MKFVTWKLRIYKRNYYKILVEKDHHKVRSNVLKIGLEIKLIKYLS